MTNNLWCTTTADLYPFGPVTGVSEAPARTAGVSVFPNPSASGRFTLRLAAGAPAGATYAVLDATGRPVASGQLRAPDTELDLCAAPPGVYVLRLTWPDGRTLARKVLRGIN